MIFLKFVNSVKGGRCSSPQASKNLAPPLALRTPSCAVHGPSAEAKNECGYKPLPHMPLPLAQRQLHN